MSIPEIDLALYHQKAVDQLAAAFASSVDLVVAYPVFKDTIPINISIEFDGFTPGEPRDLGTGQLHTELRFSAYITLPFTLEHHKRIVRQLGARLGALLHGTRFGCPGAGPARVIDGRPDEWSLPGKTGRAGATEEYEVFRVDWSFEAFMGENVWNDDGSTPAPIEVWTNNNGEETQIE